jgi:hypothetical protein
VSIRLKSGGHSFSGAELDALRGAKQPVEVVLLTAKTTLVPAEFFDMTHAADYLADVGLAASVDEVVVTSKPVNGVVAIMAIAGRALADLQSVATEMVFTSPLLAEQTVKQGSVLHLEDNLLYVRVYGDDLRFAEVMSVESDADILYYLTVVDKVYGICNMSAHAKGDAARLQRLCKQIFKNLICE